MCICRWAIAEWSIKIPGIKLIMKHYSDELKDLSLALSEILHHNSNLANRVLRLEGVPLFCVKSLMLVI